MQRRRHLWVPAIGLSLVSLSAIGHAALARRSEVPARVSFAATGPAGLKIVGTTSELNMTEKDGKIVVTVPLANLKTGIEVRDSHMRDKYLEVSKYPNAELSVARSALRIPGSGDASGELSLHGHNGKPVTVHYEVKADYSVDGTFHINMKDDFGLDPSFAGVHVKPDVEVEAHFSVTGGGSPASL